MRRIPDAPRLIRCRPCAHRLRYGTCGKPVEAGLLEEFGVVWAPPGHRCPAFTPREPQ
jgi:hypothetical protein